MILVLFIRRQSLPPPPTAVALAADGRLCGGSAGELPETALLGVVPVLEVSVEEGRDRVC